MPPIAGEERGKVSTKEATMGLRENGTQKYANVTSSVDIHSTITHTEYLLSTVPGSRYNSYLREV